MRRTLTLTIAASCLALAACSSNSTASSGDQASTATGSAAAAPAQPTALTADQVMAKLAAAVPSAKQTVGYTAATDPNSLLGRPGEYTGAVRFNDSRIPSSDTQFAKAGDVDLGGGIEVFASVQDAQTRAAYVEKVTKALGALGAEYDFQHGHVLLRISHYLTPDQAKAYEAFVSTLP